MYRSEIGRSITILEHLIKLHFLKQNRNATIFCDNLDITFKKSDVVDIVLFGHGLKNIFSYKLFPRTSRFTFWVLNSNFKKRFVHYLGLPSDSIGVLDRYELFPPIVEREYDLPKLSNFIYSGRPLTLKNFELTIMLLNHYKKMTNEAVKLEVCSPMFKKSDFIRYIPESNDIEIEFLGDLGIDWYKKVENPHDKTLINLSLDPFDDFNVSVAQWQQIGGGTIVSTFGPYAHLRGKNIIRISSNKLLESIDCDYSENSLDTIVEIMCKSSQENSLLASSDDLSLKSLSWDEVASFVENVPRNIRDGLFRQNSYTLCNLTREMINGES
ncbi:hypothetical protein [Bacteriovorax sp. Seq25_V]|uniref:hypothetical protein n=1 Tax=Bacteriovorax sp. Seq25_V TaxID=1201288 RepID=UPI00038A00FF|nr:hypothetical protein [Bacteriovorax sp. Seq25_V]EQC45614.1 hypothetical protein M900_1844 [Bacteriovorax sp. Seq25_V]